MFCDTHQKNVEEETCQLMALRSEQCKNCEQRKGKKPMTTVKNKRQIIRKTENGEEKWCSACKEYHPATKEIFYHDSSSPYKLTSSCKKSQKMAKDKKAGKTTSFQVNNANILTLDFSKHQDLLEKITGAAERELRTPERQALWWLMNDSSEKAI